MDPEVRKLLEEVHALARDNHRLLRSVRRHQILETFGRYMLWIILILLSYVSYVSYIQPFMEKFRTDPQGAAQSFFGLPTSSDVQNLINSYKPGQ
jgi:hypothetical protein